MPSTILLTSITLLGLYALKISLQFARNLKAAKESGITYTIVPFFAVNRLFQLSCIFLIPLMRKLPRSWTYPWFDLCQEWAWNYRYQLFKYFGSDTFITVSPERNALYTADPDVVIQMTTRRNDFPKPLEVYGSLRLYGDNLITSEGHVWRHHRKVTSPPFTEKNNHSVWMETMDQCQAMVSGWFGENKDRSKSIYTVANDALRLGLHIISKTAFGIRLRWQGTEETLTDRKLEETLDEELPGLDFAANHTMSYTEALVTLLHNIITVLVLPQFLLNYSLEHLPFHATKTAHRAYIEWGRYMNEVFQAKKKAVLNRSEGDDVNLMISLIKGAGITPENLEEGEKASPQSLSDEEILGNAFAFMIAGHETTANSIHFCLILLALNVASQRHLQSDLDEILQGRPVTEQDYDQIIPKLFGSMAGAVLNEELRLIPPVVGIPKSTPLDSPQPLNLDGKKCTVPAHVYITLMVTSVHRNPKYWPTGPPSDPAQPNHPFSEQDNDLEEFKPERWLLHGKSDTNASMPEQNGDTEASSLGLDTAADTSAALFRPYKGAYIPFSEGYRSCIGRRFAQVEILAVLAYIFSQYSVELAVDAFASDEEVAKMNQDEKKEVWQKAQKEVYRKLREDMASVITLQLRKGAIGLRLVKRGKEMFDFQ
ncbi:putative P450 monooxygenase [Lecanora helva]